MRPPHFEQTITSTAKTRANEVCPAEPAWGRRRLVEVSGETCQEELREPHRGERLRRGSRRRGAVMSFQLRISARRRVLGGSWRLKR